MIMQTIKKKNTEYKVVDLKVLLINMRMKTLIIANKLQVNPVYRQPQPTTII